VTAILGEGAKGESPYPFPQTPIPDWWHRRIFFDKPENDRGEKALMKPLGTIVSLVMLFCLLLLTESAVAGESGTVSCTTSGCGFQQNLKIGGSMRSPSVTGYCPSTREFVRLKLKSYDDYRKPHNCPGTKEPMQPIYGGSEVAKIPCPQCGNQTLRYKRMFLYD
jgi:hypothetical protein